MGYKIPDEYIVNSFPFASPYCDGLPDGEHVYAMAPEGITSCDHYTTGFLNRKRFFRLHDAYG